MILREKIDIEKLINNSNNYYPDRIKFCIDRKRKVVSVDEEYHIDMENELFQMALKTRTFWRRYTFIQRCRCYGKLIPISIEICNWELVKGEN